MIRFRCWSDTYVINLQGFCPFFEIINKREELLFGGKIPAPWLGRQSDRLDMIAMILKMIFCRAREGSVLLVYIFCKRGSKITSNGDGPDVHVNMKGNSVIGKKVSSVLGKKIIIRERFKSAGTINTVEARI
jgi:hypothetical protein